MHVTNTHIIDWATWPLTGEFTVIPPPLANACTHATPHTYHCQGLFERQAELEGALAREQAARAAAEAEAEQQVRVISRGANFCICCPRFKRRVGSLLWAGATAAACHQLRLPKPRATLLRNARVYLQTLRLRTLAPTRRKR